MALLPTLPKRHYHIVFIDGSHIREAVAADIAWAKQLVTQGGIICGDDLEVQLGEVDAAAHLKAVASSKDYVLEPKTERGYHPGVTQAVAEAFEGASAWEGVWAVREAGKRWESIDLTGCKIEPPEHMNGAIETLVGGRDPEESILLLDHRGYNLVRCRGQIYAISQALGNLDLSIDVCELQTRYHPDELFAGGSEDSLKARIDEIERRRENEMLVPELAGRLAELGERMTEPQSPELAERVAELDGKVSKRLEALTPDVARQIAEVEGQLSRRLEALAPDLTRRVAELDGRLTGRLEALSPDSARRVAELDGKVSKRLEDLGRRVAELDEQLSGRLEALGPDLARQVAELEEKVSERLEALRPDVDRRVAKLDEKLSGRLEALGPDLARQVGELEETLSKRLEALASELAGRVAELDEKLSGRLYGLLRDLAARLLRERIGEPHQLESFLRFNIVKTREHLYAIPRSMGPMDVASPDFPPKESRVLVAHSRRALKLRIFLHQLDYVLTGKRRRSRKAKDATEG